jgi:hypothetical protein
VLRVGVDIEVRATAAEGAGGVGGIGHFVEVG